MDRSYQNVGSKFLSKNIFSPRTPGSAGRRRITTTPSVSGRSSICPQVLYKSINHVVEGFGSSLPVQVTEALMFSDRNVEVSIGMSVSGWAWFVCGRKLLVWQYKVPLEPGRVRRAPSSKCRELTLPQSDLAHKADLVLVYTTDNNQVPPSCLAVTPEGLIRFWQSIAHEASYIEQNADLHGQECDILINLMPVGCLLATTTSTLVLLQPQIVAGRFVICCTTFKSMQGWFGGIGKRMSSLIFGNMPTSQSTETKLIKVSAVESYTMGLRQWHLYALSDQVLQKWILTESDPERFVFECNIGRIVHDTFVEFLWDSSGNNGELSTYILDMQPTDGGVLLLVAGINRQGSNQLQYAFGKLDTENNTAPPNRFSALTVLKKTSFPSNRESESLACRFLLVGQMAYMYNSVCVECVSVVAPGEESDVIEFIAAGDRVLGGALCGNVPVFFSKLYGLVSVSLSDYSEAMNSSYSFESSSVPDLPIPFVDPKVNVTVSDMVLEEMSLSRDATARLKAAFLYYVKNHRAVAQSEQMINELFPVEIEPVIDIDATLDTVVVKVSADLINDAPSGDPRWIEMSSSLSSVGGSESLQILRQLEDKQRALDMYLTFLKDVKLWDRFSAVTIRGIAMATSYVLSEHAEKLVAAMSLHILQNNHAVLIDSAIKTVVQEQDVHLRGGLTFQDFFYKEVTQVHRVIQTIVKWMESAIREGIRPQEVANMITEANTVILSTLQDVIQYRQLRADWFSPTSVVGVGEYVPWTAAPGRAGLLDTLTLQQEITLKNGARTIGTGEVKARLYDQLVNLVDIILDGYKSHLESVRGTDKFDVLLQNYETERFSIIRPFLEDEEYERAAILAEKYCDFLILIQVCELTDNKERLNGYMEKFSEQDFSQYLYNWYMQEQKQGRLLHQFHGQGQTQESLSRFLREHPHLSWLHDISSTNYSQASRTLSSLASEETELVDRKKAMLSLSKLAALASDEPEEKIHEIVEKIDTELDVILHEDDLPESVLHAFGLSSDKLRVFTVPEIIHLYICDENREADEYAFKKALDLLNYMEGEAKKLELRQKIWCQAILRDNWSVLDPNSPVASVQQTVFYKLADICFMHGDNIEEQLPKVEDILEAPELEEFKDDSTFQYYIKLCYEEFNKFC